MTIGALYNANNVVVGQAAVYVAPNGTPMPPVSNFDVTDPFNQNYALGTIATISTLMSTGAPITTLPITALTVALTTGQTVKLISGVNSQIWTLTAPAAIGATSLTVTSQTPNFAYPAGTPVGDPSPQLWVPVGATEQGWQLAASKSTQTIQVEEQSTPVATTITAQSLQISGSLSEDITNTLLLTLNATAAATAPTTTVPGFDTITLTDIPLNYAVLMVTTNAGVPGSGSSLGRIFYAPKWTSLGNVGVAFRRAAGQRLYGVQFSTVCQTNQIQIINFTAPHS